MTGSGGRSPIPDTLYHWSPTLRRRSIVRTGLCPGRLSTDGLWRPPYIAFADDPESAWELSGRIRREPMVDGWDLWMTWGGELPKGAELIYDTYADTGRPYVKEYRVYDRLFRRSVWYVGSRDGSLVR